MGISLGLLAVRHGCELRGDPDTEVSRVATLAAADRESLSFFTNPVYRPALAATRAAAVILHPRDAGASPVPVLLHSNPYVIYARIAALLHPPPPAEAGVHPAAVVAAGVKIPDSCAIGPGAVLEAGVVIGDRTVVGPKAVLGAGARVGTDSRIMAGVVIYPGVRMGSRCIVHAGAIIGSDGFGFARDADGSQVKVPQLGGVVLGDDVEIGANTTIDRGAIEDTVIGDGVKLDNQIQVGHNVRIGAHTVIAAQCGISGSTTIGSRCIIGGQAGFAGHISVADDVVIGGGASVVGSITVPGIYGGGATPADSLQRWRRNMVRFGQLDELARRLRELEKRQGRKP